MADRHGDCRAPGARGCPGRAARAVTTRWRLCPPGAVARLRAVQFSLFWVRTMAKSPRKSEHPGNDHPPISDSILDEDLSYPHSTSTLAMWQARPGLPKPLTPRTKQRKERDRKLFIERERQRRYELPFQFKTCHSKGGN